MVIRMIQSFQYRLRLIRYGMGVYIDGEIGKARYGAVTGG